MDNWEDNVDETNLKVIYVLDVGKDADNKNIYHFLLSENCEDTFAEGWDEKPSCNINNEILKPDDSQYEYIKQLKTDIKLDLAQDSCCTSLQDCKDMIIALAYENLDEAEEYPEEGRIVIHFGDYIDDVETMLAKRDMRMKFI